MAILQSREFKEEDKINESFLRTAQVLYSHWKVSNLKEKESLQCGGHSRLFEVLIPDYYVTKGESIKGKGQREHIVPCALIRNHSYKMFNYGYLIDDVVKMIKKNLIIIHITKEEQKKLDVELGLKINMPDGWEFGDDPFERLNAANIQYKLYNIMSPEKQTTGCLFNITAN